MNMAGRVLLLSSDKQLARNTSSFLKLNGLTVNTFCDPQEAVVAADEFKPDLVIVDLSLAGRSGIEFLYELRSYPDWRSIAVIVLGNQHVADIESYIPAFTQLDVARYLPRSLTSLQKLYQEVERLLRPAVV